MSVDGQPHIVAIGGGMFERDDRGGMTPSGLVKYALDLTGVDRPKICFLTTAFGDSPTGIAYAYSALTQLDADVSHLALFSMPNVADPTQHVLDQDVVLVLGGSVANLLALWRLHGLDDAFRRAWQRGVVLAGESAGAICWHAAGVTDSFGPELRPVTNGLALLPYTCGVHYDSEPRRRPTIHRYLADGSLPDGYAADDGVALHYVGTELIQAVSVRDEAAAYRIERDGEGGVKESRIETRRLA